MRLSERETEARSRPSQLFGVAVEGLFNKLIEQLSFPKGTEGSKTKAPAHVLAHFRPRRCAGGHEEANSPDELLPSLLRRLGFKVAGLGLTMMHF
jgi:hypothetical protein